MAHKKNDRFADSLEEIAYLRKSLKAQKGVSNKLRRERFDLSMRLQETRGENQDLKSQIIALKQKTTNAQMTINELTNEIKIRNAELAAVKKPWYKRIFF